MSWGKYEKLQNIFCSNRIRNDKVTKIDKDGNESVATISCKIKCIDSARFKSSSLSNLIDNLAERIHEVKYKDCDCFP